MMIHTAIPHASCLRSGVLDGERKKKEEGRGEGGCTVPVPYPRTLHSRAGGD